MAALEIGVERKPGVVCLQEPPGESGGVGISHSAYKIRKLTRVWTAVRKGRGHATDGRTDLSKGAKDDVIVIDDKRTGDEMTKMINIYNESDLQTVVRQARKINWPKIIRQGGSTILVGSMHAHSSRWDPRCKGQHDGTFWEEIIDEYGVENGNDGWPTHHWTRKGAEAESTIDLTLANRTITRWNTLDGRPATCSDHELIELEFSIEKQEEADNVQVIGWNLAAMAKEDEEAAEILWKELDGERGHLDQECTGDEVEQEAEWCQETLGKVIDANAKKIKICA